MSVPVPVEELEDAVARFGPVVYLLTTGDDGRPHATHADVTVDGSTIRCGLGRRTAANAAARSLVSMVWPPVEEGGYSLIVDGEIAVEGTPGTDAVGVVKVTNGVLHRPAVEPGAGSADCAADCAPVEVPSS